jgi:hypothetical protein
MRELVRTQQRLRTNQPSPFNLAIDQVHPECNRRAIEMVLKEWSYTGKTILLFFFTQNH